MRSDRGFCRALVAVSRLHRLRQRQRLSERAPGGSPLRPGRSLGCKWSHVLAELVQWRHVRRLSERAPGGPPLRPGRFLLHKTGAVCVQRERAQGRHASRCSVRVHAKECFCRALVAGSQPHRLHQRQRLSERAPGGSPLRPGRFLPCECGARCLQREHAQGRHASRCMCARPCGSLSLPSADSVCTRLVHRCHKTMQVVEDTHTHTHTHTHSHTHTQPRAQGGPGSHKPDEPKLEDRRVATPPPVHGVLRLGARQGPGVLCLCTRARLQAQPGQHRPPRWAVSRAAHRLQGHVSLVPLLEAR